jgi:hypothetical protein
MALKYYFEFTDVKEVLHRVEISDSNFVGTETQIYGTCSLTYVGVDDPMQSIRPSGLVIDLEANPDLTFSDLYSEDERTFTVEYTTGGNTLFKGWINPEDIFENFVENQWVISFQCSDGLGYLQNLSYVNDTTGLIFTGRQKLIKIAANCLKRTKVLKDILVNVDIFYTDLTQTLDTLDNVYFNSDRFVKDDGETIMNCDEVLRSVLDIFGASIISYRDKWVIFKTNTLKTTSNITFFSYDSNGDANTPSTTTIDLSESIGSQIDSFAIHHINGNQQKTIQSSIGAYRINFKYGFVKSITSNAVLSNNGTTITDWTIDSSDNLTLNNNSVFFDFDSITGVLNLTSATSSVTAGDVFDLDLNFTTTQMTRDPDSELGYDANFNFKVILTNGTTTYYLKVTYAGASSRTIEWSTTDDLLQFFGIDEEGITRGTLGEGFRLPAAPIDGDIYVEIHTPTVVDVTPAITTTGTIQVNRAGLVFVATDSNIEGENHTFQRTTRPSAKIETTKKLNNGDLNADIYLGAIYESDSTTLTKTWRRKGNTEDIPILRMVGEERMKMYARPSVLFSGDVFGFFDCLSVVTINNVTGSYLPISYQYDVKNAIISAVFRELLDEDIISDIDYKKTFDYGNVVEPTIKS